MSITTAPVAAIGDTLTDHERHELRQCRRVLDECEGQFIRAWRALVKVHDGKLYRATHRTFEDWLRDEYPNLHQTMRRNQQLLAAARVVENIEAAQKTNNCSPSGPTNEAQARPLVSLPADQQPEAWHEAEQEAGGKPTAAAVQRAVDRRRPPKQRQSDAVAAEEASAAALVDGFMAGLPPAEPEKRAQTIVEAIPEADIQITVHPPAPKPNGATASTEPAPPEPDDRVEELIQRLRFVEQREKAERERADRVSRELVKALAEIEALQGHLRDLEGASAAGADGAQVRIDRRWHEALQVALMTGGVADQMRPHVPQEPDRTEWQGAIVHLARELVRARQDLALAEKRAGALDNRSAKLQGALARATSALGEARAQQTVEPYPIHIGMRLRSRRAGSGVIIRVVSEEDGCYQVRTEMTRQVANASEDEIRAGYEPMEDEVLA